MRKGSRCKTVGHTARRGRCEGARARQGGKGRVQLWQRARATLRLLSFRVEIVVKSSHVAVVQHLHDLQLAVLHNRQDGGGKTLPRGWQHATQGIPPLLPSLTVRPPHRLHPHGSKDAEPFGQTTHPIPNHPLGRCTHGSGADLEALILQHLLDGDLLKAVTQKGFRG